MSAYKFVKLPEETNPHDRTKVIVIAEADTLDDLLESFERFLRGCGFSFTGHIDVVKDDE